MDLSWQSNVSAFQYAIYPKSLLMVTAAMKLKDTCSLEESYDQPRQHIKKYWNLLKFMSIELVVLSVISGFKLCHQVVLEL